MATPTRTRPKLPTPVIGITGFEGSGKTRFAVSCAKPAIVISTDTNTETTIRDILGLDDTDIVLHQTSMPALAFEDRDDVKEEGEAKWEEIRDFLAPYLKVDEDERPKALVLDTASDVFDIRVLGEFGKRDQIPPEVRRNLMGRCNTSYKGIVQAFKDRGIMVVLVHRAKEKWIDATQRTQRGLEDIRKKLEGPFDMEREGWKGTGFITSVEINLAFDPLRAVKEGLSENATLAAKYGMRIVRCTNRPGLIGRDYWGRQKLDDGSRIARASIPFLLSQVFVQTSVEDWS